MDRNNELQKVLANEKLRLEAYKKDFETLSHSSLDKNSKEYKEKEDTIIEAIADAHQCVIRVTSAIDDYDEIDR